VIGDAPDSGAKADIAGLRRWASSRHNPGFRPPERRYTFGERPVTLKSGLPDLRMIDADLGKPEIGGASPPAESRMADSAGG